MLTTKTWPEPEPDWVPICNAYSLLHHRIAKALSKFALCIPQKNAPSPFGIVIIGGNSTEIIVNYNGSDMLRIESIDILDSEPPLTKTSKWWKLESTIWSLFRDNCYYLNINGLWTLVYVLDRILKDEFFNAPKNSVVRAFGRVGSIMAPFSFIASDVWEIDRVDFELNEVVLRGGEKLYSVHFCPFDPVCTEELQPVNSIVQPSCPLPPGTMINEPIYSTGAPGRPTSKSLVLTEMHARIDSARMKPVLKDEAEALAKWLHENHSGAPSMTVRTIENAIRDLHHRAKPQKEKQ